jgi:hypothetical protein
MVMHQQIRPHSRRVHSPIAAATEIEEDRLHRGHDVQLREGILSSRHRSGSIQTWNIQNNVQLGDSARKLDQIIQVGGLNAAAFLTQIDCTSAELADQSGATSTPYATRVANVQFLEHLWQDRRPYYLLAYEDDVPQRFGWR